MKLYAAGTARTIAILPVKSFGAAKQRLADVLGGGARQALAQAMFRDVLATLRHVSELDEIAVVTADRAAESVATSSDGDRFCPQAASARGRARMARTRMVDFMQTSGC